MKNLKNVMAALAVAMLVPAFAPTAAAADEENCLTVVTMDESGGDYSTTDGVATLATPDLRRIDDAAPAAGTYAISLTAGFTPTFWKQTATGGCESVSLNDDGDLVIPSGTLLYFVRVEVSGLNPGGFYDLNLDKQ